MTHTTNHPTPGARTLWRRAKLATLTEQGTDDGWGLVPQGAILTQDDSIVWVGRDDELAANLRVDEEVNLEGALVTPALIDPHTHLVYGGHRAHEFEQRLNGVSYEDIARAGGGIQSTVKATRAASDDQLLASALCRARQLMRDGVATIEIKSGYGLSAAHEARMLRTARAVGQTLGIGVRTSYLAAHALPPEFAGRADAYIDEACQWMSGLHEEGLIDAVDAFCDRIGFTPAQTQRIFESAQRLGLPVKLHAEQLSDQGGAQLASRFGALSCDHLEHLSDEGVAAMAATGTVATLLPGAYYFLRETKLPPIEALRQSGVPIALASDHNPGSSPALSLLLMLNMACTLFRLTPLEAFRGVTVHAARALGLHDRGTLRVGQRADLAVWSLDHPRELAYWLGHAPLQRLVVAARPMSLSPT